MRLKNLEYLLFIRIITSLFIFNYLQWQYILDTALYLFYLYNIPHSISVPF